VSIATVAPADADSAPVFPSTALDQLTREHQRVAAEAALANLERAVRDLAQRFFAPTLSLRKPSRRARRRSRRSAWWPGN